MNFKNVFFFIPDFPKPILVYLESRQVKVSFGKTRPKQEIDASHRDR